MSFGSDIHQLSQQAASIGRTIATLELERIALLVRVALMQDEINRRAAESKPKRARIGSTR